MAVYKVPQEDGDIVVKHQYSERSYTVVNHLVDIHQDDIETFRMAVPSAQPSDEQVPEAPAQESPPSTSSAPTPTPQIPQQPQPVNVNETGALVNQPSEER